MAILQNRAVQPNRRIFIPRQVHADFLPFLKPPPCSPKACFRSMDGFSLGLRCVPGHIKINFFSMRNFVFYLNIIGQVKFADCFSRKKAALALLGTNPGRECLQRSGLWKVIISVPSILEKKENPGKNEHGHNVWERHSPIQGSGV